jgi:putative methionine-R-sulfoxide reductase with GAF domain
MRRPILPHIGAEPTAVVAIGAGARRGAPPLKSVNSAADEPVMDVPAFASAALEPDRWCEPAYVQRQIELIEEALTRVLFGDYAVVVRTEPGAPVWGNLAMHVNVVINAARNAIARAERERRRVEALYELSRCLASADDGEQLMRLAVETVRRLLGLDAVALRLVDGDDLVLRAVTSEWADARLRLKVGESLSGRVVATNAPVVIEDVLGAPQFDATHREAAARRGLAAFVGVPIPQADGPPLGVLFGYSRRRRPFPRTRWPCSRHSPTRSR